MEAAAPRMGVVVESIGRRDPALARIEGVADASRERGAVVGRGTGDVGRGKKGKKRANGAT